MERETNRVNPVIEGREILQWALGNALQLSPAGKAEEPATVPDVVERLTAVDELGVSGGVEGLVWSNEVCF